MPITFSILTDRDLALVSCSGTIRGEDRAATPATARCGNTFA